MVIIAKFSKNAHSSKPVIDYRGAAVLTAGLTSPLEQLACLPVQPARHYRSGVHVQPDTRPLTDHHSLLAVGYRARLNPA